MLAFADAARIVQPVQVRVIQRDPADDLILGTAIAASADYLVSGNDHLLELDTYRNIRVVSPRQFLPILERKV